MLELELELRARAHPLKAVDVLPGPQRAIQSPYLIVGCPGNGSEGPNRPETMCIISSARTSPNSSPHSSSRAFPYMSPTDIHRSLLQLTLLSRHELSRRPPCASRVARSNRERTRRDTRHGVSSILQRLCRLSRPVRYRASFAGYLRCTIHSPLGKVLISAYFPIFRYRLVQSFISPRFGSSVCAHLRQKGRGTDGEAAEDVEPRAREEPVHAR